MDNMLARRDVVRGATVLAAGLAGAGMGATHALAQAPIAVPEQWDYEADVVVVGLGEAGVGAAVEASDQGCSVVVIEKAPRGESGGGNICSGGYHSISAINQDAEESFRSVRGSVDKDVLQAHIDCHHLFFDWCEKYPIEGFEASADAVNQNAMGYSTYDKGAVVYREAMLQIVEGRENTTVLYDTPACHLVCSPETGEVIGVQAQSGGEPVYVKALKGVILCTGNFAGNDQMLAMFGYPGVYIANFDSPYNTGDGFYMAAEAGAKLWGFYPDSIGFLDLAYAAPSKEFNTGIEWTIPAPEDAHCIMVNAQGQRFVNEMMTFEHTFGLTPIFEWRADWMDFAYKNSPFWLVFDQEYMDKVRLGFFGEQEDTRNFFWRGEGPRSERRYTWNGVFDSYLWSEDNSKELERGWIVTGATLEELAQNMVTTTPLDDTVTCDADGLVTAVAAYNDACVAGKDEQFRRPADTLQPIGDGPYYAIELCDGAMYASGGPATDVNFAVIDTADQPIGRLYAAGTVSFALLNSNNTTAFSGGIKCAQTVAALEPWE